MVSVLLCVYDERKEYVIKAIESILNQTISDLELIIVLDKPERCDLKELVYKYYSEDRRVRVICNECNLGLVKSLNRALNVAKGEYVARMDADDISLPQRLEKEVYAIEKGLFDLVGTRFCCIDQAGNIYENSLSPYLKETQVKKHLAYCNCISHPTWLAKKTTFEFLNGYRNIPVAEDYDFLLRAIGSGMKIALINEVGLYYRINPNGISQSNKFKQYLVTDFLSKQYRKKKDVTEHSVIEMLSSEYNNYNLEVFEKANELLNKAKIKQKEKKYFLFAILAMKSIFKSKYYFRLRLRNLKLKKIQKQKLGDNTEI